MSGHFWNGPFFLYMFFLYIGSCILSICLYFYKTVFRPSLSTFSKYIYMYVVLPVYLGVCRVCLRAWNKCHYALFLFSEPSVYNMFKFAVYVYNNTPKTHTHTTRYNTKLKNRLRGKRLWMNNLCVIRWLTERTSALCHCTKYAEQTQYIECFTTIIYIPLNHPTATRIHLQNITCISCCIGTFSKFLLCSKRNSELQQILLGACVKYIVKISHMPHMKWPRLIIQNIITASNRTL